MVILYIKESNGGLLQPKKDDLKKEKTRPPVADKNFRRKFLRVHAVSPASVRAVFAPVPHSNAGAKLATASAYKLDYI